MSEKFPDLNKLRDDALSGKLQREESAGKLEVEGPPGVPSVNTREKFDALPADQQEATMRFHGFTDLEEFKDRHFPKGAPDINELRNLLSDD